MRSSNLEDKITNPHDEVATLLGMRPPGREVGYEAGRLKLADAVVKGFR